MTARAPLLFAMYSLFLLHLEVILMRTGSGLVMEAIPLMNAVTHRDSNEG